MPYVIPTVRISDRALLDEWVAAFGLELQACFPPEGEVVHHAQLRRGDGWLMAGTPNDGGPRQEVGGMSVYWIVDRPEDVDATHDRAVAAGMTSLRPPAEPDYGGWECGLEDRDGNLWTFGTYDPQAA